MSTQIESASVPVSPEVQELVLLETLKALLTAVIRSLSHGDAVNLVEVSKRLQVTAEDVLTASRTLARVELPPEVQRQRRKQSRRRISVGP